MGYKTRFLLLSIALFALAWPLLHPPLPHLTNSDLFTHLSVARHLAAGDGFVTDIVYPLSLTFPFAAQIPQPLIHRPPGYPLLMLIPTWLGHGDPQAILAAVYIFEVLLLLLVATLGVRCALQAGGEEIVPAWLLILLLNPLLTMATVWGQIEIAVALLITFIWCRWRSELVHPVPIPVSAGRAAGDGALAAAVLLLRLDLFWLPLFWWLTSRRRARLRIILLAIFVWLITITPWTVRNWSLTGQPFFTLQGYAEHLKGTDAWPGYTIYRSLSPEPLRDSVSRDPGPILAKVRRGLRFFLTDLGRWMPWSFWILGALVGFFSWWRGGRRRPAWRSPPLLALLSLVLVMAQYMVFSHSLRHLVVLLPVVTLEMGLWLHQRFQTITLQWPTFQRSLVLTGILLILHLVTPMRLPGWQQALQQAEIAMGDLAAALGHAGSIPPGPIYSDSAAVLWHSGRAGVWAPLNDDVKRQIERILPEMAGAPTIAIHPPEVSLPPEQ
jgi:hypothetical protein